MTRTLEKHVAEFFVARENNASSEELIRLAIKAADISMAEAKERADLGDYANAAVYAERASRLYQQAMFSKDEESSRSDRDNATMS